MNWFECGRSPGARHRPSLLFILIHWAGRSFKDELNLLAIVYRLIHGAEFLKYLRLNRLTIHSNQVHRNRWKTLLLQQSPAIASMRIFECVANFSELSPKKRLHKFRHFLQTRPPSGCFGHTKNVFLTDCIGCSAPHFVNWYSFPTKVSTFRAKIAVGSFIWSTPTGYHCRVVSAEILFLAERCRCLPPGSRRSFKPQNNIFETKMFFGHFRRVCICWVIRIRG